VGYLAIIIASLVPGSARPHIYGFPGELEHFLAYGAVGSVYGLAYYSHIARVVSGLILTAGAALLEGLQSLVPDRTPELADIVASSVGAWIGLGLAFLAAIVFSRLAERYGTRSRRCT